MCVCTQQLVFLVFRSEANKGSKLDTHPDEELVSPVQIHVTPTEDDVSLTEYHMTPTEDHVTPTEDHVTPIEDHVIPTEDLVTPSEDHLTTVSGRRESVDSDTSSLPSVPDHPLQSLREQEWISRCQVNRHFLTDVGSQVVELRHA